MVPWRVSANTPRIVKSDRKASRPIDLEKIHEDHALEVEVQVEEDGIGTSRIGTETTAGASRRAVAVGRSQKTLDKTITVDGQEEMALRGETRVLRRGCILSTRAKSS